MERVRGTDGFDISVQPRAGILGFAAQEADPFRTDTQPAVAQRPARVRKSDFAHLIRAGGGLQRQGDLRDAAGFEQPQKAFAGFGRQKLILILYTASWRAE